MKRLAPGLLLLFHSAAPAATPLTPADFAFGYDIELAGTAAIYRLPLPQDVYGKIAHADLSDLRVFNAAGEAVPHTLRRPAPAGAPAETALELPFFPLPAQIDQADRPLSVQVTRDAQGAVVRVENGAAATPDERPRAYLIDTSQLEYPPDALEVGWTGAQANFVARVSVAGSDDLAAWRTLVAQAAVARLHFAGRLLERRRIDLPRKPYRYLRLEWPLEAGGATLHRLHGWFSESLPDVSRGWTELEGTPVKGDKTVFEYELQGHAPVDRVGLALPPGNSLVAVTLSSRGPDGEWRRRHRGAFYRVEADGAELVKEDTGIATTRAAFWRVEPDGDTGLSAAPRLRLGWVLDDLYFLARGKGPYTLAYGAADAPPDQATVDELLARIDEEQTTGFIGTARAGEPRMLGGDEKLASTPPWEQILLWSVLLLGTIGLGVMAWRLWREIQERPRA